MPSRKKRVELDPAELLRNSERHATSMMLPLAVQRRLDVLAELAEITSATRAEIIGTLISEAELDSERLSDQVLKYRGRRVGEVVPDAPVDSGEGDATGGKVVAFERRGPGRPRHSSR